MSDEIRSILAAVDRDPRQAKRVAVKAVTLARLMGARLELFLCDAETAYTGKHQYEPAAAARASQSSLMESRQYLENLRRGLAGDVEISLCVACESPLYESIVSAVRRRRPDLVVRGAAAGAALDPNDWELVSACPVPLLLTRGQPWNPRPLIAAAVDVSPGESDSLTHTILRAAASFARAAEGRVELLHASGLEAEFPSRRAALAGRAREAGLQGAECRVIAGEPADALRQFCLSRNYDLIALGALTHRKTLAALAGTMTGRLIESLDTDFLLVKQAPAHAA